MCKLQESYSFRKSLDSPNAFVKDPGIQQITYTAMCKLQESDCFRKSPDSANAFYTSKIPESSSISLASTLLASSLGTLQV